MKRVKKLIIGLFSITTILSFSFFLYIKYSWKNFTNEKQLDKLITRIKSAEKLPNEFYTYYNIVEKNTLENDSSKQLIKYIFNGKTKMPVSYWVARYSNIILNKITDHRFIFHRNMSLAWKIEEQTDQKECLNYLLNEYDFLYGQIGIKKASLYYFEKEIESLNKREILTLIIMTKNPSLYNPKRFPEKAKNKLDEIIRNEKL